MDTVELLRQDKTYLYKKDDVVRVRNTRIYFIFFIVYMVLQGGHLGNIPILILFAPLLIHSTLRIRLGKLGKLFLIYWCYLVFITLINIGYNFDINNSILSILEYSIAFVTSYFVGRNLNFSYLLKLLRNFGIVLSILAIPEALMQYSVLAILLGKSESLEAASSFRVATIFQHQIVCGFYLSITLILLFAYPLKRYSLQVITVVVVAIAIILTKSRSAWLATMVVIFLWIIKMGNIKSIKKQTLKKLVIALFILLIVIIFSEIALNHNIVIYIYEMIYNRFKGMLDAGPGQGNIIRIDTVLNSINYWKSGNAVKMILGMGKNWDKYFMVTHPVIKWSTTWTAAIDNQYIATIHETGFIGLCIIIMQLIIVIKRLIKAKKDDKNTICTCLMIIIFFATILFYEGLNYICNVVLLLLLYSANDIYYHVENKQSTIK